MPVKTEKDLPEQFKPTWLKALSAMQLKNYGYAIQLTQSILKTEPDFLTGRQLSRKAAIAKNAGKKSGLGLSSSSFSTMKAQGLLKKDPKAAMEAVEKVLESDPFNQQANLLLRDAAMAAQMPETASFALETIVQGHPRDVKMLHELGRHYLGLDLPDQAGEVYTKILEINPADLVAVKLSKDSSAKASLKKGGWEREDATYRDLIRDKDAAVSLEQQGRVIRSDEMIEQQLIELGQKYEQDQTHVDTVRRIAELYEQKEDLENAVQWFTYAAQLTQNTDAALVRKAADLRIKQLDFCIQQYEEFIKANPDSDEAKQKEEELVDLKKQRAEVALQDARTRVERNPTDLMFRFELGEILVQLGNYKDAIPELQKARQNPNVRLRAMNLLGKCFEARSMMDLAAKTLEEAAGELVVMDNVKKDILYSLGLVYEKMNEKQKAIDCMKQIYEVDYGYRDVAERVERSYGG
jgi:tetratricopeptide (TPR) repeat protein